MADTKLLKAWRDEFGDLPVNAGDLIGAPRVRAAFAAAMPWPEAHLSARIVGRHIKRLLGDAVVRLPTHRSQSQRWSLRP